VDKRLNWYKVMLNGKNLVRIMLNGEMVFNGLLKNMISDYNDYYVSYSEYILGFEVIHIYK